LLPGAIAVVLITAAVAQTRPDDRATIDQRLVKRVDAAPKLEIQEGDTLFVEKREVVPSKRITKKIADYEAIVTGITQPKGIVVHLRADEVKLEPLGDKTAIVFRYAIHAEPGAGGAGKIGARLDLVERTGLANTIVQVKVSHEIKIVPSKATVAELASDFWGYRLYRKLAEEKISALERKSLNLTFADQGRIPTLERVAPEVALDVFEMERFRRRAWVAHRHLTAARASRDAAVAAAAKTYLDNLERPDDQLSGLPVIGGTGRPDPVTLKPERTEPAPTGQRSGDGTLAPITSYEPGVEGDEPDAEPVQEPAPQPAEPKEPVQIAKADPNAPQQPQDPALVETPGGDRRKDDDFLGGRATRNEVVIPDYPRTLVLDDVNIAHAGGIRFSYAAVELNGTSGLAPALFYYGQTALTRSFGIELTVPTVLINLDVPRARTRYLMGNPLLAAKYRFHLPEVEGRRPALTLRARWGIPISPLNTIPPTGYGAEEFSRPAHFADTYAFMLEKNNLGLGAQVAYQIGIVHSSLQLYFDYFFPVESNAVDNSKFFTINWGAAVGVLPLESDILGIYAEARTSSLLLGPGRTELFTYLGARSHFLEYLEGALWVSLPIGSVNRVTGFQLGADLRFSYDINEVITVGRSGGRQERGLLD
jgi:hypothetical protein